MMEHNRFRFQVETVTFTADGSLILEGRCCEGAIHPQSQFSKFFRQEWCMDEANFPHVRHYFQSALEAVVVEVRSVKPNVLGLGEAGTIVVQASQPELIQPNKMLEGYSQT